MTSASNDFLRPSTVLARRFALTGAALLGALFCGAASQPARAQDDGIARPLTANPFGPAPGNPFGPALDAAVADNGPLFWADGITRVADLDAYQKLGLNVVVVRLKWTTDENGEISAQTLAPQRAFARAAALRGLKIIFALPAAPDGMGGGFRLSADSQAYSSGWTTWLQTAVGALKNTPNLIGWMLPDDPRGLGIFDDAGWQRWVEQNYANINVVNRQWDAKFDSLDDLTLAGAADLAEAWNGNAGAPEAEVSGTLQTKERAATGHRDWAFHPAALALAQYKWDAYRALLTMWVGALRGADARHLVISGRTPDYAQLLALPSGIDVAVPDMAPGVAENDIVTHNPQSIDIARRGGKFGVMPLLTTSAGADLPASALPDLSRRWIEEAYARGARGIGFDSFENLNQTPGLASAVSAEITKLSAAPNAALWGQAPVNTAAILLAPLAEGVSVQMDSPGGRFSRGLYGFGESLIAGEPSGLVWSLRWGTTFGGVDYLAPDDLLETPLDKYATILAPQTLSASGEVQNQLASYVGNGGVLVADLGLGALQNGGEANALPPALSTLFGVPNTYELHSLSFNLNGVTPHPLLPTWGTQIAAQPGLSLTLGDGPNNTAFVGPVGGVSGPLVTAPSATVLASGPRIGQSYGGPVNRFYASGLTLNSVGRGYALFAPFRLWNNWRPGHIGFDNFLGDLISRGAALTQAGATSLVPSPVTARLGITQFPEVINRALSVSLANHNAPGGEDHLSAVQTAGAGDWLWSGALCSLTSEAAILVGGRPAPIPNASENESRARPITLYVTTKAGESQLMAMRPIALQNLAGGPIAAQIVEEREARLKLNAWPDSSAIVVSQDSWQATVGTGAPMRLTVVDASGGYRVTPRSRHRLIAVDYAKSFGKNKFATTEKTAIADERGRLTFEFAGAACGIEVTPVT